MSTICGPEPELRCGMLVQWDLPVEMSDGIVLRCDVYRPAASSAHPVILSYGPYGKLLHFADGFPRPWSLVEQHNPALEEGSTNRFQSFEVVDPERFVPEGYSVVRFDSRGAGRSQGRLDPWSAREARDIFEAIEWCARQSWCDGNVGLSGTSYLAMNQWQAAALQPPHLRAICVWEGASDIYREMVRHGGILSTFGKVWFEAGVLPVQHGRGRWGYRSRMNGRWVSGPESLTDEELEANRIDWHGQCLRNELATAAFWTTRAPDLGKIKTPLLSTANWGGQGLHLRGSIEGFLAAGTDEKWLDIHCSNHWREYYTAYGVDLQKRFFGHFLKGEDTGWSEQPRIHMQIRRPDKPFFWRSEKEWPIARTAWTKYHLDAASLLMSPEPATRSAAASYRGLSAGLTFLTSPLSEETELTGPMSATLFLSTDSRDADLFLIVRVFTPDMAEVTFPGHIDPNTPVAQGWLRASRRKLDPDRTLPCRPYHTHDEIQPLAPGTVYEVEVEILPTCIVIPRGHRIGLTVRGRDYVYPGAPGVDADRNPVFSGVGQFRHNDGEDRPPEVFDNEVCLYTGGDRQSHLLLPVVASE